MYQNPGNYAPSTAKIMKEISKVINEKNDINSGEVHLTWDPKVNLVWCRLTENLIQFIQNVPEETKEYFLEQLEIERIQNMNIYESLIDEAKKNIKL